MHAIISGEAGRVGPGDNATDPGNEMTEGANGCGGAVQAAREIKSALFRGHITAEVLARYFARLDAWCNSGRSYAAVFDIARTSVPTAAERRHVASEMAAREAAIARHCAGIAIVLTGALLRGAVTAVLWLHPLKHPHAIMATRADGQALCAGWLGPRDPVDRSQLRPATAAVAR